jgi:hypothetical protein
VSRNEPKGPDQLLPIDYVMSALENAYYSGLTLYDVIELGCYAQSIASLDYAISLYTTNDGIPDPLED